MKVCDNFFILLTNKQMEVKIVLLLELVEVINSVGELLR